MADSCTARGACPECGRQYQWEANLAGRNVRCNCGQLMHLPTKTPGPAAGTADAATRSSVQTRGRGAYELANTFKPALERDATGLCPSCGSAISSNAMICINCGFNTQEGKHIRTAVHSTASSEARHKIPTRGAAAPSTDRFEARLATSISGKDSSTEKMAKDVQRQHLRTERHGPVGLALAGLILIVINAFLLAPSREETAAQILIFSVVRFVVQIPLILIGMFLMSKIFSTIFGPLLTALLKLLALAIATDGINGFVASSLGILTGGIDVPGTWIIRISIVFGFFWGLDSWLFDMDMYEVIVLWVITFFLPTLAMTFLAMMAAAMFF